MWLVLALAGCSFSRFGFTPCDVNQECRDTFGLGAICGEEGFCDQTEIPDRCTRTSPPELELPIDPEEMLVVGSMFDHTLDTHIGRYRSAELAQSQANANGGLDGRPFAMVHCTIQESFPDDDLTKAEATVEISRWLADELGVPAIVGPAASGDTEVVYNTVGPTFGTLVISPSATSPSLTPLDGLTSTDADPGLLWRTAPPDSIQGVAIAWDMLENRDADPSTNVAVIYQVGPYGEGLESTFTDAMVAAGGTSTGYPFQSTLGPADAVAQVKSLDFDEVLFISSEAQDVVQFLLASDAVQLDLPIFLTDAARNADVLADASQAAALFDTIRGTAPASPVGAVYDSFAASYAAANGGDDVSVLSYTAHAFDASWLVMFGHAWALYQEGAITGTNIARGLRRVSSGPAIELRPTKWNEARARFQAGESVDVTGASGELDYDPDSGETAAPIEVWRINLSNDGFESVVTYVP